MGFHSPGYGYRVGNSCHPAAQHCHPGTAALSFRTQRCHSGRSVVILSRSVVILRHSVVILAQRRISFGRGCGGDPSLR